MRNKHSKRITACLMSSMMAVASVTAIIAPMSTSASQQLLGATDFEDGVGIPWHTCESLPAKQLFDISDGAYTVKIVNNMGGGGRWDLQFRHRGIKLINGHKYHIHAEITPSEDGEIYSRISNYSASREYWNDTGNGDWQVSKVIKGHTFIIDTDFTAGSGPSPFEDGPAEWAFEYACHAGTYGAAQFGGTDTGMPIGSTLTFDNMSLEDLSDDTDICDGVTRNGIITPKSNVRLNQVGYYWMLKKIASYTTDASNPLEFDIYNSSGTSVYSGESTVITDDLDSGTPYDIKVKTDQGIITTKFKDSGKYVHLLDFSTFQTPGVGYYIIVKDATGVSDTQWRNLKGAFDTEISEDKVIWRDWRSGQDYQMNKSHPFAISDTLYDGLLRDSMSYFYQNRSGVPIEAEYINNSDAASLAHSEYGHNPDTAWVQPKWIKNYSGEFDGEEKYQITATGGWYEADNHSKCVVNGGISVWTLQNMYEMSKHLGKEAKWEDGKSILIPQDENNAEGAPDALDEARVELQWMFDMMVKPEDPYFGEDAGLVYHKICDHKYTGLAIHAWNYSDYYNVERIVKPPSYSATFNMVACAAQAARLWEGIDDEFAKKCLENAETGLAAAEKLAVNWRDYSGKSAEQDDVRGLNKREGDIYFAPQDQAVDSAAYGDTYVEDDYYWALCELFATTGDKEYYEKLTRYKNLNDATGLDKAFGLTSYITGGDNLGSYSSFNWGCTSGLGTLSLYLNGDQLNSEERDKVEEAILKVADGYISLENQSGMGIPYVGVSYIDQTSIGIGTSLDEILQGYEYGSNSFVANNAIVMAYAYDSSHNPKYLSGASQAMDYILGRNGNDFSYVSGYGDVSSDSTLKYPNHRFWAFDFDASFPNAPAGVLAGGPFAGMKDDYIRALGYKRATVANQKCYVDSSSAWGENGVAIHWNAPLAWLVSYLDDAVMKYSEDNPEVTSTSTTVTTNQSTKTTTTTVYDSSLDHTDIIWGDANLDGKVTIADATAILQFIANKDKYPLVATGLKQADVVDSGEGVTAKDALAIQMVDAHLISRNDLPLTSSEMEQLSK